MKNKLDYVIRVLNIIFNRKFVISKEYLERKFNKLIPDTFD